MIGNAVVWDFKDIASTSPAKLCCFNWSHSQALPFWDVLTAGNIGGRRSWPPTPPYRSSVLFSNTFRVEQTPCLLCYTNTHRFYSLLEGSSFRKETPSSLFPLQWWSVTYQDDMGKTEARYSYSTLGQHALYRLHNDWWNIRVRLDYACAALVDGCRVLNFSYIPTNSNHCQHAQCLLGSVLYYRKRFITNYARKSHVFAIQGNILWWRGGTNHPSDPSLQSVCLDEVRIK